MKPKATTAWTAILMVACAIGAAWLFDEAATPSNDVVERVGPADDGHRQAIVSPLQSTDNFAQEHGSLPTDKRAATGNLVIALRDDAMFPVIGVQVRLAGNGHRVNEFRALSDNQGEAAFYELPEGAYLYTVEAIGRPQLVASSPVYIIEGQTSVLTLRMRDHDRAIGGRVLLRNGAPVPNMNVTARAYRNASDRGAPGLQRSVAASARSDADGRFEIGGLPVGEYEISTRDSDQYVAASAIVRAGADSAVLYVAENRMQRIDGVVTSTNGERLAGVKIVSSPGSSNKMLTDLQGHYALTLKQQSVVGRRYLRFLLDGYQESRLALEGNIFDQDELLTVNATLTPLSETVTVSGRVSDEYGRAVAGERVQFHSRSRYATYQTMSGPNGDFRVDGVAVSDDYRVWVRSKDQYGDYNEEAVALVGGQHYLDIVLHSLATGTVRGRVLDGQNNPVADFHFWLRSANAQGRTLEVTADMDGWFAVEQVPAGRLTLGTRSQPQVRITGHELTAGAVQYIDVVFDERDTRSTGLVQ